MTWKPQQKSLKIILYSIAFLSLVEWLESVKSVSMSTNSRNTQVTIIFSANIPVVSSSQSTVHTVIYMIQAAIQGQIALENVN